MTLTSAFSATVVYAQTLISGKTSMVLELFFGLTFRMSGVGAAVLGYVADQKSIEYVYHICAYLPLLGVFTLFLPNIGVDKTE